MIIIIIIDINIAPVNSFTISNAMITSDTSNHTIIINNNNNSNVGFNSFISEMQRITTTATIAIAIIITIVMMMK